MRRAVLLYALLAAGTPVAFPMSGTLTAQLAPGKLAAPHRELEGALRCARCHAGGRDALPGNCLACHGDIAWLVRRNRGYHARNARGNCASCHPDHGGADFALIAWPGGSSARFDHAEAGWPLVDAHARARCTDCHTGRYRVSPAAAKSARRPGGGAGWTGLETACAACHEDPHRGALDARCETCHGVARWTETPGFDHDRTRYPLTGRHARVACDACHAAARLERATDARGRPVPRYRPLPFAECSACHADPHRGRLGGTCADCHVTSGFATPNVAGFDHERTRYPLRGAHRRTACDRCHDFSSRAGARRSPPFGTCGACHRDPHAGTATVAGRIVDCDRCHDLQAFRPSSFTTAQHRGARYPLEGGHVRATCAACHRSAAGTTVLRPAFARCIDCHRRDPHDGPAGRDCAGCHDVRRFRPSTVDVAGHARFTFALDGAHRAVPCAACHRTLSAAAPPRSRTVSLAAERTCAGCHAGPHGDQFASRRDRGACQECHSVAAWRPADRFDHERDAAFPLAGAHARVPCARCHPPARPAADRRFRPVSSKCETCHKGAS